MNKMQKQTKVRMLGMLSILLVLVCGVSFAGVIYTNTRLSSQADYIIHAENFGSASDYLTDQARGYAATGDKTYYDNYWYEVNTAKNRDTSVAILQEMGLEQNEADMIEQVYAISNGLIPLEEQSMQYVQEGNLDAALHLLYDTEYKTGVDKITALVDEFDVAIQTRLQTEQAKLQKLVNLLTAVAAISVVVTLVMQIIILMFVRNELLQPILKIRDKVADLAQGNLNNDLELEEDNTEIGETVRSMKEFQNFQKELIQDIGRLLSEMAEGNFNIDTNCEQSYKGNYAHILISLRKINQTLDSTIKRILMATNQVENGATQISSGSQSLAQSTTEQASAVEELSATIDEISRLVQLTAKNSQEANHHAMEAGASVAACNQQMQDMIKAMNEINESSAEIGKVIKVIEDIAFQTNILALNAAVEAARAGTAGKGFAVVADEVRNLAAKSAEASKSTSVLISDSQNAVKHGMELAGETAATLEQVVVITQENAKAFARITEEAQREAMSISQVTAGVEQISAAIQTNSATSEENAATSVELSTQAQIMKKLVDYFTLKR